MKDLMRTTKKVTIKDTTKKTRNQRLSLPEKIKHKGSKKEWDKRAKRQNTINKEWQHLSLHLSINLNG